MLAPRLTIYPEFVRDPDTWLDPALRTPVLVVSDSEGLGRDGAWSPGRDDFTPPRCSPPLRTPSPRRKPGRRSARRRARGPRGRRRRDRHVAVGARPRGRSDVAAVADRAAPRDRGRRDHVRAEPQHQLHERVHVQVPVLRVLEGSALAQSPRAAVSARAGGDAAPRGGSGRVRRHRGVPAGRDPSRLRRRLLRRRRQSGESGRAADPRARVHRARGDRRRPASRNAARRVPAQAQGRRTRDPSGYRGRDPRRRSAGRSSAPTR